MARREWTLWVASANQTDLRHYRISKDALRLANFRKAQLRKGLARL